MILKMIKKFTKNDNPSRYLLIEFNKFSEDIQSVLRNIGLNNFNGQVINGIEIPATTEIEIKHTLAVIPSYRLLLNQSDGNSVITNGATPWTDKAIYLKNQGAALSVVDI